MVHFQEPPVIFQGIFQFPNGFLKSNSKHHLSVQTQCVTFFIWYWLVDIQASLKRGFWTNTNNTPLKDSLNSSQRKSLSKKKSQQKKQPTNTQIRNLFLQSHISTSPSTATCTQYLASRAKAKESAVAKSALAAATAKMRQFLQQPEGGSPTIVINEVNLQPL